LFFPETDKDIKSRSKKFFYDAERRKAQLKVSFIAMGELFGNVAKIQSEQEISNFISRSHMIPMVKTYVCRKEQLEEQFQYITDLSKIDYALDTNDLQVIATAMVDEECQGLITFDPKMLSSPKTIGYILKKMRERGRKFVVTDNPWQGLTRTLH
jgi:predicted nucleic acid-binding protein